MVRESLNSSVELLGCSPVKYVSSRDSIAYGKRKLDEVYTAVKEKFSNVLNIEGEDISRQTTECKCQKGKDLDRLMHMIKAKIEHSDKEVQLKLLTLVPESWTIKEIQEFFSVSNSMARKSKQLRDVKGLLPEISKKKGRAINVDIANSVKEFFQNDEFSRMCPGKKEFVSVKIDGRRQHKQKRLLLLNLKELHLEFKKAKNVEISFSKFCELRPKWCVPVGSASGVHSVCVCEYHQNAKLITAAIPDVSDYKQLLYLIVCDPENRDCMLHSCPDCPGVEILKESLMDRFEETNHEAIKFSQWQKGECKTNLIPLHLPVEEFVDEACRQFDILREHHFVSKAQANYLNMVKENLNDSNAIILIDFAENYSFIVQDAVQGYHWNNSQATLHPIVIYIKENNQLISKSYCVISDHLRHDTNTVHAFMSSVIPLLKQDFPSVNKCLYFSDGAGSQYKNFKNICNLSHHYLDYGLQAEWHFFATSHGKSPCDGIGGTVKRLVARASLQMVSGQTISTPESMFDWCQSNISGIHFLYISSVDILRHVEEMKLEQRYVLSRKVPGTRSYHSFVPDKEFKMQLRRISADKFFTTCALQDVETPTVTLDEIKPGQYYGCIYDSAWYLGIVTEVSYEHQDILLNFMKQSSTNSFSWPSKIDSCWVPVDHVICKCNSLDVQGHGARIYKLGAHEYDKIVSMFNNFH